MLQWLEPQTNILLHITRNPGDSPSRTGQFSALTVIGVPYLMNIHWVPICAWPWFRYVEYTRTKKETKGSAFLELLFWLFPALPHSSKMVDSLPGITLGRKTPNIYRASLPMCFFIRKHKDFPLLSHWPTCPHVFLSNPISGKRNVISIIGLDYSGFTSRLKLTKHTDTWHHSLSPGVGPRNRFFFLIFF